MLTWLIINELIQTIAISEKVVMTKLSSTITLLKLLPHLPGANELMHKWHEHLDLSSMPGGSTRETALGKAEFLKTDLISSLWAYNSNLMKILYALMLTVMIQSAHNFTHVMSPLLSYVQNCDLDGSLLCTKILNIFCKFWVLSSNFICEIDP